MGNAFMKRKNELWIQTAGSLDGPAAGVDVANASLDERAEQLFQILQQVEGTADDLTDEQFCSLVHQAVTACGFSDALDAWFALVAVTEERIALIDFHDMTPQPPDMRN
jgi:hypothetical protein